MRRFLPLIAILCVLASPLACAFGEFRPHDPFNRQLSLEEAQKRYTELVRWSKFDEAAGFVEQSARAAFLAAMPNFGRVRFTDYETRPWKLDEEKRHTTIEVTYTGYAMNSPLTVAVHEKQEWKREGHSNQWKVQPSFSDLDRLAGS